MLSTPLVPGVIDPNILQLKNSLDNGIYRYLATIKNMPLPFVNITF